MATDRGGDQDTVTLAWYDGLYSTPWIKVKLKHGGECSDWIETVSKDAIVIQDITLTAGYHLRTDAVEKLRATSQKSD